MCCLTLANCCIFISMYCMCEQVRQRCPDSRGDRYMLFSAEDPPNHIKVRENLFHVVLVMAGHQNL